MEPSTFLTLETVKTLAGQVMAVLLMTQMIKSLIPGLSVYALRFTAVANGITLHMILAWQSGMMPSAYALAFLNGALVSMMAMSAAEKIKGAKPERPPATSEGEQPK